MIVKICVLVFLTLCILTSCTVRSTSVSESDRVTMESFLKNLREKKIDLAKDQMDPLITQSLGVDTQMAELRKFSRKLIHDYGNRFETTIISSEETIHETIPSKFFIVKLKTNNRFGYYFFYISKQTGKIILVSEFTRVKESVDKTPANE